MVSKFSIRGKGRMRYGPINNVNNSYNVVAYTMNFFRPLLKLAKKYNFV